MDWSQYRHHCTWLQTLRIREDTVVSSVFQPGVSMPSTSFFPTTTVFEFGTNCRLLSLCPLPSRPSSLDCWASRRLNLETFVLFLSYTPARFYCVWNLDLSFASCTSVHAHLPCTTLLNSEECALSERWCWDLQRANSGDSKDTRKHEACKPWNYFRSTPTYLIMIP